MLSTLQKMKLSETQTDLHVQGEDAEPVNLLDGAGRSVLVEGALGHLQSDSAIIYSWTCRPPTLGNTVFSGSRLVSGSS